MTKRIELHDGSEWVRVAGALRPVVCPPTEAPSVCVVRRTRTLMRWATGAKRVRPVRVRVKVKHITVDRRAASLERERQRRLARIKAAAGTAGGENG